MNSFDVVVVGGGPGGYVAAIRAAQKGLKTAIIEGHKLGGECLNYGCIPSKAMIFASHIFEKVKHGSTMGILADNLRIDFAKMVSWKNGNVTKLTTGIGALLKAHGVTHYKGLGAFEKKEGEEFVLSVDSGRDPYDNSGKPGSKETLKTRNVILATGSVPAQIPSFPVNGKNIIGSREALDQKTLPKSMVVIGGGVIGLEIGSFHAKLGTQVTVLEGSNQLLPGTDIDCVQVVEKLLKKQSVQIHTKAKALGAKDQGSSVVVDFEVDAKKQSTTAEVVLISIGRRPRTQGLDLEKVGLSTNERGFLTVNSRLETSVKGIYAIGDVIGGPMLAHKASKEGLAVIDFIKNPSMSLDIRALPWAIFTDPEIAGVGHTVESARAAGWDPVVGKCPFSANGRAVSTDQAEGFVKIISDKKTDRILGAHMVGPEVSQLIAEVAMAIEMGATSHDLALTVHAHPTLPETIMEAAESVHGLAVHSFERKK